jgi:hypothetical protein
MKKIGDYWGLLTKKASVKISLIADVFLLPILTFQNKNISDSIFLH